MTLTKTLGGAADYFDNYKGICLTITDDEGNVTGPSCTDQVWGFGLIAEDANADIVFDALTDSKVLSAKLTFDTTDDATDGTNGSDLASKPDGTDIISIAQITIDATFSA